MNLERERIKLLEVIQDAGKIVRDGFDVELSISHKDTINNLVTQIDEASEQYIVNALSEAFPEYGFIGEELGNQQEDAAFKWIIDPIDGTVNFAHRIPLCCISIALSYKGTTLLGAVYNPMMNELFYAQKGEGAYLNGKAIKVSQKEDVRQALVVTGFPYSAPEGDLQPIDLFNKVYHSGLPIRRLGAAALDLCWVACGRFDAFWEMNLKAWDVAAGYLIVTEAGGRVSNFLNQEASIWEGETLATNNRVHEGMLSLLFS